MRLLERGVLRSLCQIEEGFAGVSDSLVLNEI